MSKTRTRTKKSLSPDERAWEYLRELMKNDEQWNTLKDGAFIQITGSEGGKYILYPNGHVIDLGAKRPKLGKVYESDIMPFPDVLCTTYAWITKDEKTFRKNWGCGNIRVGSDVGHDAAMAQAVYDQMTGEARDFYLMRMREGRREITRIGRAERRRGLLGKILVPLLVVVPLIVVAFDLLSLFSSMAGLQSSVTNSTSNSTIAGAIQTGWGGASFALLAFVPIFIGAAFVIMILRDTW